MDWESCEDEAIEDWEEDGMEEGEKVDTSTWEGRESKSEGVRGGKVRAGGVRSEVHGKRDGVAGKE